MEMLPLLKSRYRSASTGTPSALRVPSYKNKGKIGELVQLPSNVANLTFLLAASSLAPHSSSLNHVGKKTSKEGDDGA
jgi:hypothetical protein